MIFSSSNTQHFHQQILALFSLFISGPSQKKEHSTLTRLCCVTMKTTFFFPGSLAANNLGANWTGK